MDSSSHSHSLIVSLFFSSLLARETFVFTSNPLSPPSSLLLLYSFFGHTVYRQSAHSRHFAFSLYSTLLDLTRPYSHSGSDILSFIYKFSFCRFHNLPYDHFYDPFRFNAPVKGILHSTLDFPPTICAKYTVQSQSEETLRNSWAPHRSNNIRPYENFRIRRLATWYSGVPLTRNLSDLFPSP